jgi:hypothetical protein
MLSWLLLLGLKAVVRNLGSSIETAFKTNTLVILAFGQSYSACFDHGGFTSIHSLVEHYKRTIFEIAESLKGVIINQEGSKMHG